MRSYLIYEKRTSVQLPVAICYTVKECADFIGVSLVHAFRLVAGLHSNPDYGIFVDEYDPTEDEDEGRCTATICPPCPLSINRREEV